MLALHIGLLLAGCVAVNAQSSTGFSEDTAVAISNQQCLAQGWPISTLCTKDFKELSSVCALWLLDQDFLVNGLPSTSAVAICGTSCAQCAANNNNNNGNNNNNSWFFCPNVDAPVCGSVRDPNQNSNIFFNVTWQSQCHMDRENARRRNNVQTVFNPVTQTYVPVSAPLPQYTFQKFGHCTTPSQASG